MAVVDVDGFGSSSARSVVFLHGAGANRKMWASYRGGAFRVIAPDLPGHGSFRHEPFVLQRAVEWVAEVIDREAGGRAVVCGLSLGGYVAIALADRYPERVEGLVISGASASYLGWGGFTTRLSGRLMRVVGGRMRSKAEQSLLRVGDPEITGPIVDLGLSMRGAADALIGLPGHDFHAMAQRFVGPVLILNGERDSVNRKEEHALLARLARGRIETIEDAGHSCAVTRPDAFRAAVERFVAASIE